MPTRPLRLPRIAASAAVLALVGCGAGGGNTASESRSGGSSSTSSSGSSSTTKGGDGSSTSSSSPSSSSTSDAPHASACVAGVRDAMSDTQKAGQLIMAAMQPGPAIALDPYISGQGLGSMLYLVGWEGSGTVKAASDHLQQAAPTIDGTKVGMLVAADQEGGEVQQLTGAGFSEMPSGLEQARDASLRDSAKGWGTELKQAGVNVNLAPTADTVPDEIGRANEPIGKWGRQYGSTPEAAGKGATAFARGMQDAGVQPTAKHFPGIGRITGNTYLTAEGTSDETATRRDPYLTPFAETIESGTKIIMVGSARYPKIDGDTPAVFSEKIIDGMLREDLSFDQVVVTDDVGVAKSVAATPVGERATQFVDAGGDIVLTAEASQVPTMVEALTTKAKQDKAFAAKMDESVTRVLTLKDDMGLLGCG